MRARRIALAILIMIGSMEPLRTQYVPRWEVINHVPTDTHLRAKSMDVSNDRIVAAFQEVDSDILQVWVTTDARGAWTLLHQESGVKVREVCAFFRNDARIMVVAVLYTTSEWDWDGDDSTTMLVLTECSGGGFNRSFRHEGVGRKTIAQRKHGVAVLAYHPTTSYDSARLTIEIRNDDLMLIGSFEAVITSKDEHSYRRVDSLICDRLQVPSFNGLYGGLYHWSEHVPGWSNSRAAIGVYHQGNVLLWRGDSSMIINKFHPPHITSDQYRRVSLTQRWHRHPDAKQYHVVVRASFGEKDEDRDMRIVRDIYTRDTMIYVTDQLPGQLIEVSVRPVNQHDLGLICTRRTYLPFLFRPGNRRSPAKPPELTLMPNPATTVVSIGGDRPADRLIVVDLTGSVVSTSTDARTLDVSHLPTGTYVVLAQTGESTVTEKLFVQR
ncbi:MAG: T9SS type A sorting domain-containing protein [Ignavibacteria bacterium]|nr:T9SS type A sorting domain-containing protein [Ignavibacteria bacterium]